MRARNYTARAVAHKLRTLRSAPVALKAHRSI